jgi:hypothetical protein
VQTIEKPKTPVTTIKKKTKPFNMQFPDPTDEENEFLTPQTIAETQLNLLIQALKTLSKEGALNHCNFSEGDMDLIKAEMRTVLN